MTEKTTKTPSSKDSSTTETTDMVPLVSVIIPVWNTAKSVEKLIQELFHQSYQTIEIIAIDDGSSDNSLQVLHNLAKADKRLKVIHQENAGVSAARNRGIDLATGKYLIFIDSDDEILPDFVEALVGAMQKNPNAVLAVVGRKYKKLREGKASTLYMQPRRSRRAGESLSSYVTHLMILDGRMYGMTGRAFIAETIQKNHLRVEEGRDFAEDTKFAIDYLAAKDGEIIFIPKPLYIYNFGTETSIVHKSSLSWANWQKSYHELRDWMLKDNHGKLSLRARILLALIYLRWRIANQRSKRRAKKSYHK